MSIENLKILHICSEYPFSTVYKNLIAGLDRLECHQTIYIPLRLPELNGRNKLPDLSNTNYVYSKILSLYTRINFSEKIRRLVGDMEDRGLLHEVDLIHAHYLFSHGAAALEIKRKRGIPYVATVRQSDINTYFPFFPHLRSIAIEVLENADKVILITPAFFQSLKSYIPPKKRERILDKIEVIPNGVEQFWLEHKNVPKTCPGPGKLRLIYVGEFSSNKNLGNSIQAVRILRKKGIPAFLELVGGYGRKTEMIRRYIRRFPEFLSLKERITEQRLLLERYRAADIFVMTSFRETFGLVYLEALSQGLPIIYTSGQGFDGYCPEGTVGYPVDPRCPEETAQAVLKILDRYCILSANALYAVDEFSWDKVIAKVVRVYEGAADGTR